MNTLYDTFLNHMAEHGKIIKINGESTIGFFKEYDEKKDSNDHKYLFTYVNTLKQGDIIEALGSQWINISHTVNVNGVYEKGLIRQIKYSIKFAMPDGDLYIFPAIIDSRVLDITTNQYISMPDGKIMVTLQENEQSSKLSIDQRFIIMGNAWKIVGIDKSKIGLITLHCEKDMFDTVNDDIINEIADAKKYIHTYTIDILNGDIINLGIDATLQLEIYCTDNGQIVENPEVTYLSNNESVATVDSNGLVTCHAIGQATITATYKNVSDTIIINVVEVVGDNYEIQFINPATSIYINQTETFNIKVLNNGVEVTDKAVVWSISDITLATIQSSTNNSCTLKASNIFGNVVLRATLADDENVFAEISIKIKSFV